MSAKLRIRQPKYYIASVGNLRDYITVLSIAVAAITGLVRIKKINPAFYPFIIVIWMGLLNECTSLYLIKVLHRHTMVNTNVNILFEALLVCWQFEKWGLFDKSRKLFYAILVFVAAAWIIENFIFFSIHYFSSYAYIANSFILVLLSISQVNELISRERRSILKNPIFLICITFIAYYTCAILVEAFILYGLNEDVHFISSIFYIFLGINVIANINFTIAILWIPTKQRFTLPS